MLAVLDRLEWAECVDQVGVGRMRWTGRSGQNVLDRPEWAECVGQARVGRMC